RNRRDLRLVERRIKEVLYHYSVHSSGLQGYSIRHRALNYLGHRAPIPGAARQRRKVDHSDDGFWMSKHGLLSVVVLVVMVVVFGVVVVGMGMADVAVPVHVFVDEVDRIEQVQIAQDFPGWAYCRDPVIFGQDYGAIRDFLGDVEIVGRGNDSLAGSVQ